MQRRESGRRPSPVGLAGEAIGATTAIARAAALILVLFAGMCDSTSPAPAIAQLNLSPTALDFQSPASPAQTVTAYPISSRGVAVAATVTWASSNTSVATVTTVDGTHAQVTAVSAGTATITASAGSKNTDLAVTVRGQVRSVSLAPSTIQLVVGGTTTPTATVDADPGVSRTLTWTSSNTSIAIVNAAGLVTGVSRGSATISAASVTDPTKSGTTQVTVGDVVSVTVTPATRGLLPGGTAQLVATVTADPGVSQTVTWASSNPAIVTVSSTGLVTAQAGAGTVIITATSTANTTKSGSATVSIGSVTSVNVAPGQWQLFVGQTVQLTATVVADPGLTAVTWTSSNPAIATVNATGLVTAVSRGSATITATSADPTKSSTAAVSVTGVVSLVVAPQSDSIRIAGQKTLTAAVVADPGASTQVTWVSRNPAVATVNATTGQYTGVALGTTYIVAASVIDGQKRDSARVKVADACTVPVPMTLGGPSVTGQVNASSCGADKELFAYTLGATTPFAVSVVAPFAYNLRPLWSVPRGDWYFGGQTGSPKAYVIAEKGSYMMAVQAVAAGTNANVTASMVPWDLNGCEAFLATTGISTGSLPISTALCDHYCPAGLTCTTPNYNYFAVFIMPALNTGEQVTITATGTGLDPRLELWLSASTDVLVKSGVAAAGSGTLTLSYVATGAGQFLYLLVSTAVANGAGSVRLTIAGPSVTAPAVLGNLMDIGDRSSRGRAVLGPIPRP